MIASRVRIDLPATILISIWLICFQSAMASDELPRSLRIPLISKERIPIGKVLAHPDHYQLREIRLTGTVTAIQTETITNRMICGLAHERTMILVEDDSGTIEIIDRGACGRNQSVSKAPMVKVGEQIDLLVLITVTMNPESRETVLETTIRFLDRARY